MTFKKLSLKQKQVFKWCYNSIYDAIICDGAVRSGKTSCMITSFILWAMDTFHNSLFGICGKTVRSAERNIIIPLQSIVDITHYFKVTYIRSSSLLVVEGNGKKNSFYVFGGKDESSYMLIQGITLSGVFFDEVVLMPQSFVEQARTRTLSVENAKLWFNCNPANEFHWFYKEWILEADKRNALHLHFLMSDNPILTQKQLETAEKQFTGVFYDRYIKGLWVSAEGIIYKQFAENATEYIIDKIDKNEEIIYCNIGFDFGGNQSAHAGICTGFTRGLKEVIILEEYYRKEIITPTELEKDVIKFIRKCQSKYKCYNIYFDSAEQVLIKGIKTAVVKERLAIEVHNARKDEIIERIRFTNQIMSQKRFKVLSHCEHVIRAFKSAVWVENIGQDKRLDDGKYNIDSLDAFEYSTERLMKDIIERG